MTVQCSSLDDEGVTRASVSPRGRPSQTPRHKLDAQSGVWVIGVVRAQQPDMNPPLSLADSHLTTQPQKSTGSKRDKGFQKPSLTVQ